MQSIILQKVLGTMLWDIVAFFGLCNVDSTTADSSILLPLTVASSYICASLLLLRHTVFVASFLNGTLRLKTQ